MRISDLFKEKELTEKQIKEREYKKKIKKIRRKLWKNPLKVVELMEESYKLMEKGVKDGVITQKEYEKTIEQINKDMDKMNKITNFVRR